MDYRLLHSDEGKPKCRQLRVFSVKNFAEFCFIYAKRKREWGKLFVSYSYQTLKLLLDQGCT